MFIQLLPLKQWMLMYGYRRSYNTSRLWIQIEYYLSAQHWCVIRPTTSKKKKYSHIYIHIGVNLYEVSVYLCVKAFIYAHSQGYETYMEYPYEHVIYFAPATKNKMPETYEKKSFLLTRGYGLVIIFMGSYQIGSVILNILFVLTVMHILRTSYDVYICAHGGWIGKMYSQEIELCIFQMQSYGEMCTECNYYYIYKQNLQYRY